MIHDEIERLLRIGPFQPFEMLLADQRKVAVNNLDFVSLLGDRACVVVYRLPDEAEIINLDTVVSLKFREPDLMVDIGPEHA
jgi:hypothetical protein